MAVLLCSVVYGFHNPYLEESAKVVNVIDGNTIEIMTEDKEILKIIFNDVDSPELGQEFGMEAKLFTEDLLLKKKVQVVMKGKDRWGNRLAIVTMNNGMNPERELVEAGLAWHNIKSTNQAMKSLQAQSKEQMRGLWASPEPTPPWVWRRQQTMLTAKSQ